MKRTTTSLLLLGSLFAAQQSHAGDLLQWDHARIELMRDTMREAPGVGLAAPQIG